MVVFLEIQGAKQPQNY